MSGGGGVVDTLLEAAKGGLHDKVKDLLDSGVAPDSTAPTGMTALILAAGRGHLPVVKLMVSKGADVRRHNLDGDNAFTAAAAGGHLAVLQYLKTRGVDVNYNRLDGHTALMAAARNGHMACVDWLVSAGATVSSRNADGSTAFILAAAANRLEVLPCLLSHGANVNAANHHGTTALMVAAQRGYYGVVELLLGHHAHCMDRNNLGDTALDLARAKGHDAIVALLARHCPTPAGDARDPRRTPKKDDLKALRKRLKAAEREILRLQGEKDRLADLVRSERARRDTALAEAIAARNKAQEARDWAAAELDRERRQHAETVARLRADKERMVAAAERERVAALAARDDAISKGNARVRAAENDRDVAVGDANRDRKLAVAARDAALTAQRQAECMLAAVTSERDRAVDGWARAEASVNGGATAGAVLPSDAVNHVPGSATAGDGGGGALASRRPPPPPPLSDTASAVGDPRSVGTPGAPSPAPVPEPQPPAGVRAAELVASRASQDAALRGAACRELCHLSDVSLVDRLAVGLLPLAEWPVRHGVDVDGQASFGDWLSVPLPSEYRGNATTSQYLSAAHMRRLRANRVFSIVDAPVAVRKAATSREDRVNAPVPVRVSGGPAGAGDNTAAGAADGDGGGAGAGAGAGAAGDAAGVPGVWLGPKTGSVTFLVACGGAVLRLKGFVPVAAAGRQDVDFTSPAVLDAWPELFVSSSLLEAAPHPNLLKAVHKFNGSSALVRPWVAEASLATLPSAVPYVVYPHHPISLHTLVATRHAAGCAPLSTVELLLVLAQTASALAHMLRHGFVHRDVSAHAVLFDCRQLQRPGLPAGPSVDAADGGDAPATAAGDAGDARKWCGVEVAKYAPVVVGGLHCCRRVTQASGADYIFGERTQLAGCRDVATAPPEVRKYLTSSAPVPSGGHAVTLRALLGKGDVYALGRMVYQLLLPPDQWAAFPSPAAPYREWDVPALPASLPRHVRVLVARMVAHDAARRPSPDEVQLHAELLMCSAMGGSRDPLGVASVGDAQAWLRQRRLELAFSVQDPSAAPVTMLQRAVFTQLMHRLTVEQLAAGVSGILTAPATGVGP